MSRPLTAVLTAFRDGAGTLVEVQDVTGLDASVVRAAVDHLTRLGRLEARELRLGCPSAGCGACPVATSKTGCVSATSTRSASSGLRTLSLARQSDS